MRLRILFYIALFHLAGSYLSRAALFPSFPPVDISPARYGMEFEEYSVYSDGVLLNAWLVKGDREDAVVLLLGGNAEDRGSMVPKAAILAELAGVSVLVPERRGFGGVPGSPSEETMTGDAERMLDLLSEIGFENDEIIIWGRSLGGATAAETAAKRGIRMLVLENTFASLRLLARDLLGIPLIGSFIVGNAFDTETALRRGMSRVLIFAARDDGMIPPEHARRLLAASGERGTLVSLPHGGHNESFYLSREVVGASFRSFVSEGGIGPNNPSRREAH